MSITETKFETGLEEVSSIEQSEVKVLNLTKANVKANIGPLSLIALGFNICNSWAGVAATLQIVILQGGPVTLLYGMFISTTAALSLALTLAELASVYPTAGGQYHFVSILAPERTALLLSYICGIFAVFSWVAIGAAVLMVPAEQIVAMVAAYNPGYVPKAWHEFLIYQVLALFVLVINIFVLKRTPRLHDVGFALTLTLFVTTSITLLARSSPKAPSEFVWGTFINETGWPDGLCFLTGLLTTAFMFAGIDSTLHLAEECQNPRKVVPRATMLAVTIGFLTAFPFSIILLYSITDIDAILEISGYITFEVYAQGMRSETAAAIFTAVGVVLSWFVLNAIVQTSSRITWSFARDNGLLFSQYLTTIHPKLEVPVNALLLNWVILVICGCIFVASQTAFNAILSSAFVLQQISFIPPAALLLYRRRSPEFLPPNRAFRLPPVIGWTANILVVVFGLLFIGVFCIPPFRPVTASNMIP
ncbi:hypothetical protein AYL99_12105 [Fonsecaea erecta]|uniref:Choline transport protein n=1 Tax=Fonsecaea erecta TaxID=1367422 RepID=A0A178Z207_9EURO|nr:hypothetical protein AYL99_12105 [Fonsecaea erecta]OAP53714.1 hypothetical protein AYL99_12105 [Fonsecaea erecta]